MQWLRYITRLAVLEANINKNNLKINQMQRTELSVCQLAVVQSGWTICRLGKQTHKSANNKNHVFWFLPTTKNAGTCQQFNTTNHVNIINNNIVCREIWTIIHVGTDIWTDIYTALQAIVRAQIKNDNTYTVGNPGIIIATNRHSTFSMVATEHRKFGKDLDLKHLDRGSEN